MPNHLHLLIPKSEHKDAVFRLGVCLRATSQALETGPTWAPSPPPQDISDAHHLLRQIRYVHLNPCRKNLVNDPSLWRWSTHRDLVGAAYPKWLDLAGITDALKLPDKNITAYLQKYITGDPSVRIDSLPLPKPSPLERTHPTQIPRAVLFALRPHRDWPPPKRLEVLVKIMRTQPNAPSFRAIASITGKPLQTLHSAAARSSNPPPELIRAVTLSLTLDG